mmetsp:Transcript_33538/g.51562  ORF Transcript_33538/g.51562 Transcript_33538/m.51562 type:complete len:80 (-) Transcript_33538:524-763(-)
MKTSLRPEFFFIIEMFRTAIMVLLAFYYVKMTSESLLTRQEYLALKWVLRILMAFFSVVQTYCGFVLLFRIKAGTLEPD